MVPQDPSTDPAGDIVSKLFSLCAKEIDKAWC